MTRIVRWEPFRDLAEMRGTVDRLFYRGLRRPRLVDLTEVRGTVDRLFYQGLRRPRFITWQAAERFLPVDVYETDDDVVVEASLPGLKPEEVQVSVTGDRLSIKGESKSEDEEQEHDYYRKERRYGSYERSLTLPVEVDADKAKATFENGELSLRLPKIAAEKAKTIEITANGGSKATA